VQSRSVQIRQAGFDDSDAIARIHVAGLRASYAGLAGQDYLDSLDETAKTADWRRWFDEGLTTTLLACDDQGAGVGFVSFGRLRTPPPGLSPIRPLYSAEIYGIYLLPAVWRQCIGRLLLAQAATHLRAMKHKSLCLWVVDGNKQAHAFYKALGGQRIGKKKIEIGGRTLSDIAYGWRDTTVLSITG
jgi:GNAT superfamily N-acetyltransferase